MSMHRKNLPQMAKKNYAKDKNKDLPTRLRTFGELCVFEPLA